MEKTGNESPFVRSNPLLVTGLGAVLFLNLVGPIHSLMFSGRALVHYNATFITAAEAKQTAFRR